MEPTYERSESGLFVIRLGEVSVHYDRSLTEAIMAGAPNTPTDDPVWLAADWYQRRLRKKGTEMASLNLVNSGYTWTTRQGLLWIDNNGWVAGDPWQTYAVAEKYLLLPKNLRWNFLSAICLQQCEQGNTKYFPAVNWYFKKRTASVGPTHSDWIDRAFVVVVGEVV